MPNPKNEFMTTRAVPLRLSTLREDDRSVEFVISSEEPCRVFDRERWEVIDEILVQSGMQAPDSRQVPLQDCHSIASVTDTLGSMRELRQEGANTAGRAFFSRKKKAVEAFQDVQDGHLTHVSVGYSVLKYRWLKDGETTTVNGRQVSGPLKISEVWRLRETSLVPVAADSNAKARAEAQPATPAARAVEQIQQEATPMPNETPIQSPPVPTADNKRELAEAVAKASAEATTRALEIHQACRYALIPSEKADELVASNLTVDQVRKAVLEMLAQVRTPVKVESRVEMGQTDGDKFRAMAGDALTMKAIGTVGCDRKPVDGSEQFARMSLHTLAQECLRRAGINPYMLSREDMLSAALGRRSSSSVPSLNTGDFTYILADVANKSVMAGWQYAPTTYQLWCSIGSIPDFKAARRVSLSDAPDMLEVPEGAEVTQGVMTNTGESVTLVTYARKLCLTRQCLINDDLGVFQTIFRAFGFRAASMVNALPYAIIVANTATLADGGTIFNTTAVSTAGGHANQAGTGTVISVTNLAAGDAAMFAQAAPQGTKLNLIPRFLLTGAAYKTQAQISCGSGSNPDATFNSGTINPFNVLQPIADANITGNKWFLTCDPMMNPTVEVAFLDGNRNPTLKQEETSPILGVDFTGYIDATAKALDFRGMYYNPGA